MFKQNPSSVKNCLFDQTCSKVFQMNKKLTFVVKLFGRGCRCVIVKRCSVLSHDIFKESKAWIQNLLSFHLHKKFFICCWVAKLKYVEI